MKFMVVWKRVAQDQLAEIWLASKQRGAVAAAANELDRLLQQDPASVGESRTGNRRIKFIRRSPLPSKFASLTGRLRFFRSR
jgi:plasmid stabilization system protein ParE